MLQGHVVGSTMAFMTSMGIHHNERTGATYMSTVMISVGLMSLGTPLGVAAGQTVIIKDITDAIVADNHCD